jgi:hypothetical protein
MKERTYRPDEPIENVVEEYNSDQENVMGSLRHNLNTFLMGVLPPTVILDEIDSLATRWEAQIESLWVKWNPAKRDTE